MNEKKKVLIITNTDLGKSGVPYVIYSIVKALCEYVNFHVITMADGSNYYFERLATEGVSNVTLSKCKAYKPKTFLAKVFWLMIGAHWQNYKIAKLALKNKNYYAVHGFLEFQSFGLLKAAKKVGIEKRILHVNTEHGLYKSSRAIKDKFLNWIEQRDKRLSIKYATDCLGVSKPCCEHAFGNSKCVVLHNDYDEQLFNQCKSCSLADDHLVLAHIATFSVNKNQLFVLRIINELKEYGYNVKALLIGTVIEKNYYCKILDYITINHLEDNVEIVDGSGDISDYLRGASYGILPSRSEGAGLVVTEFQACGMPVFASTAVPMDMNCGGVTYLNLEDGPKRWAQVILDYFRCYGNARHHYDVSGFSHKTFRRNLMQVYCLK